jgi:hypothetical protein
MGAGEAASRWPAVAGFGHRQLTDEQSDWVCQEFRGLLEELSADRGTETVISGMIPGTGHLWAEAGIRAGMQLHAIVPYPAQAEDPTATLSVRWTAQERREWARLIDAAARFTRGSVRNPETIEQRKQMLAAHAGQVVAAATAAVAVWDARVRPKGTYAVIRRTVSAGKPVIWLDPVRKCRWTPSSQQWLQILDGPAMKNS